jgi:hypothetical protein
MKVGTIVQGTSLGLPPNAHSKRPLEDLLLRGMPKLADTCHKLREKSD